MIHNLLNSTRTFVEFDNGDYLNPLATTFEIVYMHNVVHIKETVWSRNSSWSRIWDAMFVPNEAEKAMMAAYDDSRIGGLISLVKRHQA